MATLTPRTPIPPNIAGMLTAAGFDPESVGDITVSEGFDVLLAGVDYDPYFLRSRPGDEEHVRWRKITFDWWDGQRMRHASI